jgi:hypothetical protein
MFGKKNETSPVAVIEPEPTVAQPEPAPVPAPAIARVVVLRPLHEGRDYVPEEQFDIATDRAQTLQRLGLVRILDPNAPEDTRPKITRAREAANKAGEEATARTRERGEIEKELERAEAKVGALQTALNAAEGLEVVRQVQDTLAEAQHSLQAQRVLYANVAQRAQQAGAQRWPQGAGQKRELFK